MKLPSSRCGGSSSIEFAALARAKISAQSVVSQLDPKSTGWVTVENLASYFVSVACSA